MGLTNYKFMCSRTHGYDPAKKLCSLFYNYFKIGFPKGAYSLWQGVRGSASPDIRVFGSQEV